LRENEIVIVPGETYEDIIDMGLNTLKIDFSMKNVTNVSNLVSTFIYENGAKNKEISKIDRGPVKVLLPQGAYNIRFDLNLPDYKQTFWKKNVYVSSEKLQSFIVTFPQKNRQL